MGEGNEMTKEVRYEKAVDGFHHLADNDKAKELIRVFTELGDYKFSQTYAEKCRNFAMFEPGAVVPFGTYKGKPVYWKVLERRQKKIFLIANEIVDRKPFNVIGEHEEYTDAVWSSCTLRRWLNTDFLHEVFTTQQQMDIIFSKLNNNVDYRWDHNNGPDTMDKLFIFNLKELDEYLPDVKDRALGDWWWLRGHGCGTSNQQAVYKDGTVYTDGIGSQYDDIGVRPAMRMLLH